MNTRGLMELVILNIGLDIGVISPALFSMMVIMALFTTFMTTPVLRLICGKEIDEMAADKIITKTASPPLNLNDPESYVA
jgi:Kef-type K+ transport system membrane component KefB